MKKTILIISLCIIGWGGFAQKVDTTYYDKNWRGVKFKELAHYIRFDFNFNDPMYDNRCRIFYPGGQVEAEGTPLSYEKLDGTKARWKGELTRYYQNGTKKEVSVFDNSGVLNGKRVNYRENGEMLSEESYANGLLHGRSLIYDAENPDICYITEFNQGSPVNNETYMCYRSGRTVRVDFETRKIIVEKPLASDCKEMFKDGIATWYYEMNGIQLSLSFTKTNLYGKYYQCFMQFTNNTNEQIEINPEHITGYFIKGDKTRDIEMVSADEYLKKIARTQAWSQALAGFSSGMNTYNAGYSTSTTYGTAVGYGGWATGASTTTTYNPAEKRAVINEENQKLANQAAVDKQVFEAIDGGILKRTVVEPGNRLVKSFFINYLSADKLFITVEIAGQSYPFEMKKFQK
jgi:hypothetical protein